MNLTVSQCYVKPGLSLKILLETRTGKDKKPFFFLSPPSFFLSR